MIDTDKRYLDIEAVRLLEQSGIDGSVVSSFPWNIDRYRLWSLFDVIRFHAPLVAILMRDLSIEASALVMIIERERGHRTIESLPHVRAGLQKMLDQLLADPAELPVSQMMRRKIERLRERVSDDDLLSVIQAEVLLKELHNDLLFELSSPYFLMIPTEQRPLYEQRQPLFGSGVEAVFPAASYDIAAAGRCMALDEWTATVFHLMRVLELGLRNFADRLGLQMAKLPEYENWHQIITAMENEIARLKNLPKAERPRAEILEFYSDAATDFRHFKDAWRNNVSHSRDPCDGRDAKKVWHHVASFMGCLAEGPSS